MPVLAKKLRGYEGQAYYTIGTGTQAKIAHLSAWDLDIKADDIDFTDHDTDGWKDTGSGLKSFSGTAKLMYYTNALSQADLFAALTGAEDVAMDFRPVDVVGETAWLGSVAITGYKLGAALSDAQAIDITFSGRGILTKGTIVTVVAQGV
jgi:predicted secreted protein